MRPNRETCIQKISDVLTFLALKLEQENSINLVNWSVIAESFFCDFLNILFGWELSNMNVRAKNNPGFDLYSEKERIIIQISAQKDVRKKINDSFKKIDVNTYKDYRFKHVAIRPSVKEPKKEFLVPDGLFFDKKTDIIDNAYLINALNGVNYERILEIKKLGDSVIGSKENEPRVKVNPNVPPKAVSSFVGRKDYLEELKKKVCANHVVVLTGMAGIGKKELARKFADIYYPNKAFSLRYNCSLEDTFTLPQDSYGVFEDETPISGKDQLSLIFNVLKSQLSEELLWIIEDADENANWDLLNNLPCHFLITCNHLPNEINHQGYEVMSIGFMKQEEAKQLFLNHYKTNGKGDFSSNELNCLNSIVKKANGHPLTLELIAKICREARISLKEMAYRIDEHGFDLSDIGIEILRNNDPMERTFMEHMVKLCDISAVEQEMKNALCKLCVLNIDHIEKKEVCALVGESGNVINKLVRYGWLVENNYKISMCRVWAGVLKYALKPKYQEFTDQITWLKARLQKTKENKRFQFVQQVIGLQYFKENGGTDLADLNDAVGRHQLQQYCLNDALVLFQNSYAIRNCISGCDTIMAKFNIAETYYEMGKYPKAETLYKELLDEGSIEDSMKVGIYNRLDSVYRKMRRNKDDSFGYLESASDLCQNVYGEDNLLMASVYNHKGCWYIDNGEYGTAKYYFDKALQIRIKYLGEESRGVAEIYLNLGVALEKEGEYNEARTNNKEARRIYRKLFKKKHVLKADLDNNIGIVYYSEGKYSEALRYYQKALAVKISIYGHYHLRVVNSIINLGNAYRELGSEASARNSEAKARYNEVRALYNEAEARYNDAVKIIKKMFGESDRHLALVYRNIASLYRRQKGKEDKALEYFKNTLEILNNEYEGDHPEKASVYLGMGNVYLNNSKTIKDARKYCEAAAKMLERVLGVDHPDTASAYNSLGVVYEKMADYNEALIWYEKALLIRKEKLNPEHPYIKQTIENIKVATRKRNRQRRKESAALPKATNI